MFFDSHFLLCRKKDGILLLCLDAYKPKWVNSVHIFYGVNTLRLQGLHFIYLIIINSQNNAYITLVKKIICSINLIFELFINSQNGCVVCDTKCVTFSTLFQSILLQQNNTPILRMHELSNEFRDKSFSKWISYKYKTCILSLEIQLIINCSVKVYKHS